MGIKQVLDEREKTHGSFAVHSEISQSLKSCLWHREGWLRCSTLQREALEMILHKAARIIAGKPNHADHWQDIAGYATLVVNYLEKREGV